MRPLDNPPLRLVPALAALLRRLPVPTRDVRRIAAPLQRAPDRRIIVALVGRQMLRTRRARSGPLDRGAFKRGTHRLRVVAVSTRDLDAERRAPLVGQDVALRAQL